MINKAGTHTNKPSLSHLKQIQEIHKVEIAQRKHQDPILLNFQTTPNVFENTYEDIAKCVRQTDLTEADNIHFNIGFSKTRAKPTSARYQKIVNKTAEPNLKEIFEDMEDITMKVEHIHGNLNFNRRGSLGMEP